MGSFLDYIYIHKSVPAYKIYSGSPDSECGIFIPKTDNPAADQIAICKAAKEIEAQCHEIAERRRELDRIAEACK
jgi:hypothetical protein